MNKQQRKNQGQDVVYKVLYFIVLLIILLFALVYLTVDDKSTKPVNYGIPDMENTNHLESF